MNEVPKLGEKIRDGERRRDAIHIAVAPVTAAERLVPGQHVGLVHHEDVEHVGKCHTNIGIVDPFLTSDVEPGERFWLFLYPGTITSLRHLWTHPAFTAAAGPIISAVAERDAFIQSLKMNENDTATRLVYADWLDQRGEHEEANRQRKWPAAKEWLVRFCNLYNPPSDESEVVAISYEKMIENGRAMLEWSDSFDCGNNQDMCDALRENAAEFLKNCSIVTGIPVPPEVAASAHFSCGC